MLWRPVEFQLYNHLLWSITNTWCAHLLIAWRQCLIGWLSTCQSDLVDRGSFQNEYHIGLLKLYRIIGIGRVFRGTVNTGEVVVSSTKTVNTKVKSLKSWRTKAQSVSMLNPQGGDVIYRGPSHLGISDTICDPLSVEALPALQLTSPPSATFQVNQSPLAGTEGE